MYPLPRFSALTTTIYSFSFLEASAATFATDKQVISTYHTDVPRDL